jgi:PRTRC genetic system ThiF family protein
MDAKERVLRHYAPDFLLRPEHRVGVLLAGCGGTGSRVLGNLARMDFALRALGPPGLYVVAADPDHVQEHNLGRQIFGLADIGRNKAAVAVTRVNRYFSLDWRSTPRPVCMESLSDFQSDMFSGHMPVIITCLDSVLGRKETGCWLGIYGQGGCGHVTWGTAPAYWLDFGNGRDTGQVVLGTAHGVKQPDSAHKTAPKLPHVLELFPRMAGESAGNAPTCSMARSLMHQDLFVNSALADLGVNLVWRLLRHGFLEVHGFFMNVAACEARPIRVSRAAWERFGYRVKARRNNRGRNRDRQQDRPSA